MLSAEKRTYRDGLPQFTFADLKIRTKSTECVSFKPNEIQGALLSVLGGNKDSNGRYRGLREMVLKARQVGMSTISLGMVFLDTINNRNTRSISLAHNTLTTQQLFTIVKGFYEGLPADLRPKCSYDTKSSYVWNEIGSRFDIGTAGTRAFGRGFSVTNVHGSEVGYWPDAESIMAGMMQAVPDTGNVFLETTANGRGNWFFDEYYANRRGMKSTYRTHFYGWNYHKEYRRPVTDHSPLTVDEQSIVDAFGLDEMQVAWMRHKVQELGNMFRQEYPLRWDEAFLKTGARILDKFSMDYEPAGNVFHHFSPPKEWRHYLIIDPGWRRFAALFAAVDPEGNAWLYDEYYASGRLPAEHYRALCAYRILYGCPDYDCMMDPASFSIRRTDTGREAPSWHDELMEAASHDGDSWLSPRAADNGDPLALRVNRLLETHRLKVADSLQSWIYESDRWTRKAPRTGIRGQETADPDTPIKKFDHLMDCTRYLCNEIFSDVTNKEDVFLTERQKEMEYIRSGKY